MSFCNSTDMEVNEGTLPRMHFKRGLTWKDNPDIQYQYEEAEFVSEALEHEFEKWTNETPVLISAQTGAGKNTFIEDVIMPWVEAAQKKILIVSNRIALNLQTKRRLIIEKKLAPKIYGDEWLRDNDHYSYVSLYTYHKFLAQKETINFDEYQCVVFDEAHFFVADALFNYNTGLTLNSIPDKFKKCLRIYMTATPDQVLQQIIDVEKEGYYKNYPHQTVTRKLQRLNAYSEGRRDIPPEFKLLVYDFKRDYSYINAKYFADSGEIVSEIKSDTSGQKWLIFVTNREAGKELQKEFQDEAAYIDAYVKKSLEDGEDFEEENEYQNIIKDNNFNSRILITTSVLDNGINLEDDELKNVVIFTYDKTMFLQMLGRKRLTKNKETVVNLYIENKSSAKVTGMLSQLKKKRTAINLFKNKRKDFFERYYNSGRNEAYNTVSKLFFFTFDKNGIHCMYNHLAEIRLKFEIQFLEGLILKIQGDPMADVKEQLSWMGLENTFDERNFLTASGKEVSQKELRALLEDSLDKTFNSKEEFEAFGTEVKRLYGDAYGKIKNERTSNDYYGESIINKIMEELEITYVLKTSNKDKEKMWFFQKKEN